MKFSKFLHDPVEGTLAPDSFTVLSFSGKNKTPVKLKSAHLCLLHHAVSFI